MPTPRSHILVGIGQRYHVIVEADPKAYEDGQAPLANNFWIRITVAKCFRDSIIGVGGYDTTGILRYDPEDTNDPVSEPWKDIGPACRDETDLVPKLLWDVKKPANSDRTQWSELFDVAPQRNPRRTFRWQVGRSNQAPPTRKTSTLFRLTMLSQYFYTWTIWTRKQFD